MQKFIIPFILLLSFAFNGDLFSQDDQLTAKGAFSINSAEEHYFLFILNNRPADLPEMRGEITKYIWKYYPSAKLKITQIKVDGELEDVPMIHVQTFANKAKAMAFYKSLKSNRPDFLQMGMTVDYFAISKTNYEHVLRSQSLEGYKPFFLDNYK